MNLFTVIIGLSMLTFMGAGTPHDAAMYDISEFFL